MRLFGEGSTSKTAWAERKQETQQASRRHQGQSSQHPPPSEPRVSKVKRREEPGYTTLGAPSPEQKLVFFSTIFDNFAKVVR